MPHRHVFVLAAFSLLLAAASPESRPSLEPFQKAIDAYMEVRKEAVKDLPKLPKDAEAQQMTDREKGVAERIRAARPGAQPGDVIVTEVRPLLRARLDAVLAQRPAAKQKEIATGNPAHEDGKPVPLRVNAPYPASSPRSSVPTAVLAVLPPLPKELEYRFYGDHLLLLDTEAGLIVDFMTKAADPPPKEAQP